MTQNPIEVASKFKYKIGTAKSKPDAEKIWECLSEWIYENITQNKAVLIKNLGTFTVSQWKLDTGIRKEYSVKNPAFVMSKQLVQDYELNQLQPHTSDKVPVILTNYFSISKQSGFDRVTVESSITQTVQALLKLLHDGSDLKLIFPRVGVLEVRKKEVKFEFESELRDKISGQKDGSEPQCKKLAAAKSPITPPKPPPCELHAKSF